jgi:fructokinase
MPKVICLGECLIDRISAEPGVKYQNVTRWNDFVGGAPANVAAGLTKLGDKAYLVSAVGDDDTGTKIKNFLSSRNIDTKHTETVANHPSRVVYVELDSDNDRHFVSFGDKASDTFADTQINWSDSTKNLLKKGDILISGSLGLAFPTTRESILKAVADCKATGAYYFIDPNVRPVFWRNGEQDLNLIIELCLKADMIKMTKEEARLLCGSDNINKVAKFLPNAEMIFITDGPNEISYKVFDKTGIFPAYEVKTIDTTGAGDGFIAGVAHKICNENYNSLNAEELVKFGCAVGALVTLDYGPINPQPSLAEVEKFIQEF